MQICHKKNSSKHKIVFPIFFNVKKMRTEHSRSFSIVIELGKLPDDCLIDWTELSTILCLTPAATRQAAYRNPKSLPPRFEVKSRHLRWRIGTVREWIKERGFQVLAASDDRIK